MLLLPVGLEDQTVERLPIVCLVIALITLVAFVFTWVLGGPPSYHDFESHAIHVWGLVPAEGAAQAAWVTHMFLHAGWLHLIGNLLFLYVSAPYVEADWGPWPFVGLYLMGGLAAALAQVMLDPGCTRPLVGSSGAVAACIGAFCVTFPRRRVRIFYWVFIRFAGTFFVPAWLMGAAWFSRELFHLYTFGSKAGVAFGAHIGGFLFGAAVAIVMRSRRGKREVEAGKGGAGVFKAIRRAREARERGEDLESKLAFEEALALDPGNVYALEGLVELSYARGSHLSAARYLDRLLASHMRAGDDSAAVDLVARYSVDPTDLRPPTAFSLASSFQAMGRLDMAEELLCGLGGMGPGACFGGVDETLATRALLRAAELNLSSMRRPERALALAQRARQLATGAPDLVLQVEAMVRKVQEASLSHMSTG